MDLTVAQTHVGKFIACIGFLQSAAWFLLSIICLVWHFEGLTFLNAPTTYQEFWEMTTYQRFLSKDVILTNDAVATPTTIAVFCFFYIILCASWFTLSTLVAWGINRRHEKLPLFFRLWGYNTYLVTLADVVLLIIVSVDYNACIETEMFNPTLNIANEGVCTSVFVPVMTIVARGFVLVLVNVTFCLYAIRIGKELGIKAHQGNVIQSNPYGAISSSGSTIPRAVVQQSPNPYQQYPPSGSYNPNQTGQPQNWGNSPATKPTGTYPPQQRQVY